jgi:hypothetical protein
MSARTEIPEATLRSIEVQEAIYTARQCGCEYRPTTNGPPKWWLCAYHQGHADASEEAAEEIASLNDMCRSAVDAVHRLRDLGNALADHVSTNLRPGGTVPAALTAWDAR